MPPGNATGRWQFKLTMTLNGWFCDVSPGDRPEIAAASGVSRWFQPIENPRHCRHLSLGP
jgi:hypothetical protein